MYTLHKLYFCIKIIQIFVAIEVVIVASVLVSGLASPIYAQPNMTGGMAGGGNMSGGNITIINTIDDGDDGGNGDGDGSEGDDDNDGQSGDDGENN